MRNISNFKRPTLLVLNDFPNKNVKDSINVNNFNDKTPTKQIWSLIKSFKRNITRNNGTTQDL